ncbi:MAG: SRPBCC domain-containing protein [Bacteroidetes bacterium]|nr:SRPBCC domain-containing protein [Bacteroidota bacterium]
MQTQFKTQYKALLDASIERVWQALTDATLLKQYFFGTQLITSWQVGSEIIFQGEWQGQAYKDKGIVLEYEPHKKAAYSYLSSWSGKEDKPENYLWVCYEIKSTGHQTELTISQTNYDEEAAKHSANSWASLIEEMKKIL